MRRLTLLLVVAILAASCGDSADTTTTTTAPEATTATTAIPEEIANAAIAVVVSAIDAKNGLDLDGWLMAFEGGERKGVPLFAEELLMNATSIGKSSNPAKSQDKLPRVRPSSNV